jgi:type 1 glutamine amidotransferase
MLGHDKHAFANENLRKLLKQGIDWLSAERKDQSVK